MSTFIGVWRPTLYMDKQSGMEVKQPTINQSTYQEDRIDNSVYLSVSLNIINVLLFLSRKNEDPRVDSPDLWAELEIG